MLTKRTSLAIDNVSRETLKSKEEYWMRKVYIVYDSTSINNNENDVVIKIKDESKLIDYFKTAVRMRPDEIIVIMREAK